MQHFQEIISLVLMSRGLSVCPYRRHCRWDRPESSGLADHDLVDVPEPVHKKRI